jgi:hypothetical protein
MFVAGNCIDCPKCFGTIFMQQSACQSIDSIANDPGYDVFF